MAEISTSVGSAAYYRYREMEREAEIEAKMEAAVNTLATAFNKKHKADGWMKFAYQLASRANKR